MKVAIFGGSFNPFHKDHLEIIKQIYRKGNFEEIWIIPTKNHAFDKLISVSDENRLDMIKIGVNHLKYVKILDIELKNKSKNYTIDTIAKLRNLNPTIKYNFSIVIGSDNFKTLDKWKQYEKLIEENKIIVIPRDNEELNETLLAKYNAKMIWCHLSNLKSSDLRKGLNLKKQITSIKEYCNKHGLYIHDRLIHSFSKLDKNNERYQHSINVGELAYELALKNNINPIKAKTAGCLHDITKFWKYEKNYSIIKNYIPEKIYEPAPTLHAYSGYCYLRYELLYDVDICNAVKKHTSSDIKMTVLDKIIFVSDKLSKERNNPELDKYRKIAHENIEEAFLLVLELYYRCIKTKKNIGQQIEKTVSKWLKK